jgi:DNA-binding MarR family transcriptional regulator
VPKRNGSGIELLADPLRRRLVAILALRICRPSRIAEELGLSPATVSYHLRLLREAGLVRPLRSPIDRRVIDYAISPDASGRVLAWLVLTETGRREANAWAAVSQPGPGQFDPRKLDEAIRSPTIALLAWKEEQARANAERRRESSTSTRRDAREEIERTRRDGLSEAEIRRRRPDPDRDGR